MFTNNQTKESNMAQTKTDNSIYAPAGLASRETAGKAHMPIAHTSTRAAALTAPHAIARKTLSILLSAALIFTMAFSAVGCSGNVAVAATVNGVGIKEEQVTNYIQKIRELQNLTDDATFGEWLGTYGYTPAQLREDVIEYYETQILIPQAAEEMGVVVEDSEIDEIFNQTREQYTSDDEWKTALEQSMLSSDDDYKAQIKLYLQQQGLSDIVKQQAVTDDQMNEYVKENADALKNTRKTSHILFASTDTEKAQSVLDQINAGTLDFAQAAKENSTDTASASDGGNVGWDATTKFIDEYANAAKELSKDQVSGLVTSTYGIHIIKCTDIFQTSDELTSISQLPEDLQTAVKEAVADQSSSSSSSSSSAYTTWLKEYKEKQDIKVNDMPSGLPYDVEVVTSNSNTNTSSSTDSSNATSDTNASTDNSENATDANTQEATNQEGDAQNSATEQSTENSAQ